MEISLKSRHDKDTLSADLPLVQAGAKPHLKKVTRKE